MQTLWDERTRAGIRERIGRLTPGHRPHWGRMNAPQMLVHVTLQLRCALGEVPSAPIRTPLRFAPVKHLAVWIVPWPKGAPTAPELLAPPSGDFDGDRAELHACLDRFAARDLRGAWPEHPAFGPLSGRDWGRLGYRHLDHHLRQFGL